MTEKKKLSKRQEMILTFIAHEVDIKGYPPSVREICEAVKLKSTSSAHNHLNQLQEKGYIIRDPSKPRAIKIVNDQPPEPVDLSLQTTTHYIDNGEVYEEIIDLPVFGNVAAGDPIFADDNLQDRISFPMRFVREEGAFMLRVRGDSMINVGIYDRDYIIVSPQTVATNGEIIVALIGEEATCKTYYHEKGRIRLQPENDNMEPIFCDNPMIVGRVIGVFRDMH